MEIKEMQPSQLVRDSEDMKEGAPKGSCINPGIIEVALSGEMEHVTDDSHVIKDTKVSIRERHSNMCQMRDRHVLDGSL